ncbi:hypothetical protein NQ315_012050, partial [Exocentrus adspersus]
MIWKLEAQWEEFIERVVDQYSDEVFRENFRLARNTFNEVLRLVKDRISTADMAVGHHTISAKAQLLITLWYLATPDSYRRSPPYSGAISFKIFPSTIGAIDGTHIPIPQPKDHGISYINRHNYSSIILQAVCTPDLKFIDCYAGEVGSCHDANVLKRSPLGNVLLQGPEESFPNDVHMIGDKAYPCLPQLMVPYRDNGHLTRMQQNFYFNLSRARSTIERAFALLKNRFRCLQHLNVLSIEWIPKYIVACCVLHNICIENNGAPMKHSRSIIIKVVRLGILTSLN